MVKALGFFEKKSTLTFANFEKPVFDKLSENKNKKLRKTKVFCLFY